MRQRRQVEQLEFRPPTTSAVLQRMQLLAAARDGWVNLLPGVPEEDAEPPSQGLFSSIFGAAQPPVSMCTWVPAGTRRGAEQSVGVLHPRGRFAARQLADLGVGVPAGWRVAQDHARRGLIVRLPSPVQPSEILEWMLSAGEALAAVPLTGMWQARVFLPRSAPGGGPAPGPAPGLAPGPAPGPAPGGEE